MTRQANLAFERAPMPSVVFGCLLPAPWLGAIAGLVLAFGPVEGLPYRFAPLTLALVHLLAVGMLMPVMLGALFQLSPVVAGVPVPGARWLSPFVVPVCGGIAGCLAWGFLAGAKPGFLIAAGLAAGGLSMVAVTLIRSGRSVVAVNATTSAIKRIGWPLLLTAMLGVALAGTLGAGWALPLPLVLDLHVGWALGGWLAALLASVAATVLPMFWQTPRLPERLARWLPWTLWAILLPGSLLELSLGKPLPVWRLGGWSALALLSSLGVYAVLRARRRHDVVWPLWLAATLAWLCVALLGLFGDLLPPTWPLAWWLGVLALVGGGVLPVNAMLGKIIPFLVWLHLRKRLPARVRVPAMQTLLPPRIQRSQAWLVLLALLLLLLLPWSPHTLALPAGLIFAASQIWLGGQLLYVLSRFIRLQRSLR